VSNAVEIRAPTNPAGTYMQHSWKSTQRKRDIGR
jgi:hypothetical protein